MLINKETADSLFKEKRKLAKKGTFEVPSHNIFLNSMRFGYMPTVLLLALILATPIPLKWRKIKAIFWGMILIHLYLLFKVVLWIIESLNNMDHLAYVVTESPFWKQVYGYLFLAFVEDMPLRIIIPMMIWILVCFRKTDIFLIKPYLVRTNKMA